MILSRARFFRGNGVKKIADASAANAEPFCFF